MRKITLSIFIFLFAFTCKAQTIVATFDTLHLSQPDTFYVNYSSPGNDVGFDDAYIHFPCVYDTSFGYGYWSSGFAYSNMTDSVTSGYSNQYSAKTAIGYNGSTNYAVAYGKETNLIFQFMPIPLKGPVRVIKGFYITNNTYAYNSMRDGDAFAKKFGGVTGNDPDWFKLTVFGFSNGVKKSDSVEFYLADFRDANNANDYIVKDWRWVNLDTLGYVDSLQFQLSSSDNGQFGMNTPAYFCMDNFTIQQPMSVNNLSAIAAKVFPNPTKDKINIQFENKDTKSVSLIDMTGKVLSIFAVNSNMITIPLQQLPSGIYVLLLDNGIQKTSVRFVKQ